MQVVISDASEPAEGEHKIMRFIRAARARPGYDHATRHAVYGQVGVGAVWGAGLRPACEAHACMHAHTLGGSQHRQRPLIAAS